jgi:phosphoribosyl 1,2-cyclic phosphodiesterase
MLDAGILAKDLKKKLFDLGIGMHQIKGAFITHEHMDHIKGVKDLLPYMPVYLTEGTLNALNYEDVNLIPIKKNNPIKTENGFTFVSFEIRHDAAEPVNYIFKNSIGEFGIYITDTGDVKVKLPNIRPTFILIEANFDRDVLRDKIEASRKKIVRDRGFESKFSNRQLDEKFGHLSYQDTIRILKTMQLGLVKQITLCHVSPTNGHDYFADRVAAAFENKYPVKQLKPFEVDITIIEKKTKYGF